MFEIFDGFGISWEERGNDKMTSLLANISLNPNDVTFAALLEVEALKRSSFPNNIKKLHVFEDDRDILRFLKFRRD